MSVVGLDVTTRAANVVFQAPARCQKRIADGQVDVFVRSIVLGKTPDHDVFAGDAEIDLHPVDTALVVMSGGRLDEYPTRRDSIAKELEAVDPLSNVCRERLARWQLMKGDLRWYLHDVSTCQARAGRFGGLWGPPEAQTVRRPPERQKVLHGVRRSRLIGPPWCRRM